MKLHQPHRDEKDHLAQMPTHVGVIMDGNGRWASYRGRRRTDGHYEGWRAALRCVESALEFGVPWLSLYAFTSENWKRPRIEVDEMLAIGKWSDLIADTEKLIERGARLYLSGRPSADPATHEAFSWLYALEAESARNDKLNVVVAFNYGGLDEIVDAARAFVASGKPSDSLDRDAFREFMYVPGMPDVDIVVRTGGERRLSNFMLWHVSYAELVFTDTLFPDFTRGHFVSLLYEFQNRSRRFGGLPDHVTEFLYP